MHENMIKLKKKKKLQNFFPVCYFLTLTICAWLNWEVVFALLQAASHFPTSH